MKRSALKLLCQQAREASRRYAMTPTAAKDALLKACADALIKRTPFILRENAKDVAAAKRAGLSAALIDRLLLTPSRIQGMADSLRAIADLPDPVGAVLEVRRRPNGLLIKKVRVPIGVILIIYESRPNVTSDCTGLCLKSGNAVILRGGKEALCSNRAIFTVLRDIARSRKIPDGVITLITDTDRALVNELLCQNTSIDLVMPRGGESLIRQVIEHSRIPVIKHYKGVCHAYVDKDADLTMAADICFNAKVQRPGVCNAMETMLVHRAVARKFLPRMLARFADAGVEIRGCARTRAIVSRGVRRVTEADWYAEYLDLILAVRVVDDLAQAVDHIMRYGSYHSDAIVTENKKTAAAFLRDVDSACVYVNASTRFTDGGEFGKGAEIGISTDKLHARGPMGVEELTSYKYLIYGDGQTRK